MAEANEIFRFYVLIVSPIFVQITVEYAVIGDPVKTSKNEHESSINFSLFFSFDVLCNLDEVKGRSDNLQLRDWLELSLNHSVPSSLLILSR